MTYIKKGAMGEREKERARQREGEKYYEARYAGQRGSESGGGTNSVFRFGMKMKLLGTVAAQGSTTYLLNCT